MSDNLVTRLWASDEASALTNQAARRTEADAKLIQEMRAALEEIAGNGDGTGRNPQLMVDAACSALSKARSQQEGETE